MENLISVIVPIYKVEAYLRDCVDSILAQTYQNLEIILVDDGSPDNCGAICDEYAEKDSRIRVIHKPNGGLSDARNAGMRIMTGQLLYFIDSDDTMEPHAISTLHNLMQIYQAPIVIGGMQQVEDETGRILKTTFDGTEKIQLLSSVEAMTDFFYNGCAAWGTLYRREIFEDLFFPIGQINEDEAIILSIFHRSNIIIKTNTILYNYRFRTQSITTAPFALKDLAWKENCRNNLAFVRRHCPELENIAAMRYRSSLMWHITKISLLDDCSTYSEQVHQIMVELKSEKKLFDCLPTGNRKLRLQYLIASRLGFKAYRTMLRIKQGRPL